MAEKRVFLCYRQQDVPFAVGRIADCLKGRLRLGSQSVFRYIDSVGVQFDEIVESLFQSDVVVVVIGKSWHGNVLPDGRRCLEDPNDFLRLEIEYAFARNLPVIPVLIEDASLGYPNEFPDPLKPLSRINPVRISDRNVSADSELLLIAIKSANPISPPAPGAHEKITAEDLVLIWTSWRSPKHDYTNPNGDPVYRFDVVIGAESGLLDRIEKVIYFLPPRKGFEESGTNIRSTSGLSAAGNRLVGSNRTSPSVRS